VDEHKLERLETAFGRDFTLIERRSYEERLCLTAAEAAALVAMGPSARHTQAEEVTRRLAALGDTIRVTLAVSATTYALRQA
jgi:23S rRNA (guanine745-N1)-methyltransferase